MAGVVTIRGVQGFLNPIEARITFEYLTEQNIPVPDMWRQIKAGMDDGTFYYLGTGDQPLPPPNAPTAAQAPAQAQTPKTNDGAQDTGDGSSSGVVRNDGPTKDGPSSIASGSSSTTVAAAPAAPIAPAATVHIPSQEELLTMRARTVTSTDNLCDPCANKFFNHGPLYQWRKSIPAASLPAQVTARKSCRNGRLCYRQHNKAIKLNHASRLNHICERAHRGAPRT
ncbi:hypothetical protein BG004_001542 [Podila humilis]|nr:hypothetical protein BG004_001542 [Podila humilis]